MSVPASKGDPGAAADTGDKATRDLCEKAYLHAMDLSMQGKDVTDEMRASMKAQIDSDEGKRTMAEGSISARRSRRSASSTA